VHLLLRETATAAAAARANDAHAAEAALCVVRGVDQRPQGKEEQEDRRCK
jgi:hypothetical protein